MALKLYTYRPNYRAWKAEIAAAYNNVKVEFPAFTMNKDNKSKEFLAKNPLGKVPVLETPNGCLFESNAIARYVGRIRPDTNLCGSTFFQSGLVDQWIDFSANELEAPRAIWLYPILGYMQYDAKAYNEAKKDITKALNVLNDHLKSRTFLVGNQITLADIVVVCALVDMYRMVFAPNFRKQFGNVNRWFDTCINQPQFKSVIGPVVLAKNEQRAAKPKKSKKDKKGGDKKQKQKQKQQPKKARKPKNPLDALPKSSMHLDTVKKLFFANKEHSGFFDKFWPMFDAQGYSIFIATYNYDEDNQVFFMTCNLIQGYLQRLESLRKYGFGVLNILGADEDTAPFNINGCWIVRGTGNPPELKDCGDSEYYTFTKVDTSKPAERKKVEDFFLAQAIGGTKVLERRFFK